MRSWAERYLLSNSAFDLHGSVVALANSAGTLTDAYRFNGWREQVVPGPYRGAAAVLVSAIVTTVTTSPLSSQV
jgi:hypothetical protein